MDRLVVLVGVLIGILLSAGFISLHAMALVPPTCPNPYGGCTTPTASGNLIRALAWVGVTVLDIAMGLSVALAFIAGGARSTIAEGTRRMIYLFATVFLAVWLVFGTTLALSLLTTLRYM